LKKEKDRALRILTKASTTYIRQAPLLDFSEAREPAETENTPSMKNSRLITSNHYVKGEKIGRLNGDVSDDFCITNEEEL